MKITWFSLYNLTLALWVGGIAIFTFVIAPTIFKSYGRDQAGEIIGRLFPGYFLYTLVLAALALILFFSVGQDRSSSAARISLVLLALALVISAYTEFKLHPDAVRVKQQVSSFEREPADSPARKQFSRLHALSASLNLLLLADGIALLLLGPALKK
jgi:thiol:disulfide interchange protein